MINRLMKIIAIKCSTQHLYIGNGHNVAVDLHMIANTMHLVYTTIHTLFYTPTYTNIKQYKFTACT